MSLAIVVVIGVLAAGVGFALYQTRELARMRALVTQRRLGTEVLADDIRALFDSAVGLGERLQEVEQRLRAIEERQDQIELKEPSLQNYSHAIRLVKQGASIDEILVACDITRGEAELIALLYRMDGEIGAAAPDMRRGIS